MEAKPEDFGSKQEKPKGFSTPFLKLMRNSPYLQPADVVVAGDPSTEQGRALTGTYLDDGRALIPWDTDHELIVTGFLTGSHPVKVKLPKLGPDGAPVLDEEGNPVDEPHEVMVSEGPPELVYLQGRGNMLPDDEWYPVMQDGRQRRRGAIELQRRLDWCAAMINGLGEAAKSKPARRNLFIKIGARHARGEAWAQIVQEMTLPADAPRYESPEIGNPEQVERDGATVTAWPAHLGWLTETFAKMLVGSEDLGEQTKRGWLQAVKGADGGQVGVRAYPVWLKVQVVGTNVDPSDPHSLLEGVATKQAQVPTPPSLFAEQIARILGAKQNPNDPKSPPLYSRAAVAERFGMADSTLVNYALLMEMCDEVKALIDSGQMSMTVALSRRESAFVAWPKNGSRIALPYDKQRLVLAHMRDALDSEDVALDNEPRYTGPSVLALGKKLRDRALAGKLGPVGHDDDEGAALPTGPATRPAGAPAPDGQAAPPTGPEPAPKGKRAKSVLDAAAVREHFGRAIDAVGKGPAEGTVEDPADHVARVAMAERMSLARAVALVACGAEPLAVLDQWPTIRDLVAACVPAPAAPAGPPPVAISEEGQLLDWISVAVEEGVTKGLDKPVVTEATASYGKTPTAEQVRLANERIDEWTKEYAGLGPDAEAKSLDEYLLTRVVAAQNAA